MLTCTWSVRHTTTALTIVTKKASCARRRLILCSAYLLVIIKGLEFRVIKTKPWGYPHTPCNLGIHHIRQNPIPNTLSVITQMTTLATIPVKDFHLVLLNLISPMPPLPPRNLSKGQPENRQLISRRLSTILEKRPFMGH